MISQVPRNADLTLKPGDKAHVYRETDKRYMGPYPVLRVVDKQVCPRERKGSPIQYTPSIIGCRI